MKAENFEKAQSLFEQAVKSFEVFKAVNAKVEQLKRASFSNVWFNLGNLFAAQKKYQ